MADEIWPSSYRSSLLPNARELIQHRQNCYYRPVMVLVSVRTITFELNDRWTRCLVHLYCAQYGILYGGMASCTGRNVLTYSRHYQLPVSYLLNDHCTASKIDEICKSRVPVEFYNKVLCVLELEMIKKNIVYVPSMFFQYEWYKCVYLCCLL